MNRDSIDRQSNILRVGQLNLQNTKAAGDEARQTLVSQNMDVLMLQEPYSVGGQVKCFGLGLDYFLMGNQINCRRPMTAIIADRRLSPFASRNIAQPTLQLRKLKPN